MRLFDSWHGWRKYQRLGEDWRKIVFYSESGQDWHFFEPLIRALLEDHREQVTYISSDPGDPGLALEHPGYRSVCLPEGLFLIIHFQVLKAGVLVLTMMDLGNMQLKRSINPVHYIYLFHSMGSTHMVDHANSYDSYDTLFCVGPHHVRELRKREELAGLEPRHLFEFGYPRLEALMRESGCSDTMGAEPAEPTVLIAPTWGENSILNTCGKEMVSVLLQAGCKVIVRPHYQTLRLAPQVVKAITDEFASHSRFEFITQMGESRSLFRSDVLICDWSAMAIEYFLGLEKPVLFIDLPRRIRNPGWQRWGLEPLESSIRESAGMILDPLELSQAPGCIRSLVRDRETWRRRAQELRDKAVFNVGESVAAGAAEIARLAALKGHSGAQDGNG